MSTVVHVKNISPETTEKEFREFFSFCGKISSLSITPESDAPDSLKSATMTFEKETAAKTALLLDNTQLGKSQVSVSAGASLDQMASAKDGGAGGDAADGDDISQDDKPRSRVVAEYLAHGYVLSDQAITGALALDKKHGISERFTKFLSGVDAKVKATDKARGLDDSYQVSNRAKDAWRGVGSYFERAMGTPTGQKLVAFYAKGDKEVRDIHTEARRLADLKAGKPAAGGAEAGSAGAPVAVPGADGKTTCNCGGADGICTCAPGECACSGCAKSTVQGDHTATGPADTVAAGTGIPPLGEKKA